MSVAFPSVFSKEGRFALSGLGSVGQVWEFVSAYMGRGYRCGCGCLPCFVSSSRWILAELMAFDFAHIAADAWRSFFVGPYA